MIRRRWRPVAECAIEIRLRRRASKQLQPDVIARFGGVEGDPNAGADRSGTAVVRGLPDVLTADGVKWVPPTRERSSIVLGAARKLVNSAVGAKGHG